jgi:outer membrane protein TolC
VERTRAVLSQTLNDYAQVILESLGEVEDSLTQELKQRELIESLSKQFNLSLQVIQRVRDNYTHGGVDYLRVLDALLTHQLLERTLLEERRRLFEFRINLCRAIGGGWELNPTVSVSERGRES